MARAGGAGKAGEKWQVGDGKFGCGDEERTMMRCDDAHDGKGRDAGARARTVMQMQMRVGLGVGGDDDNGDDVTRRGWAWMVFVCRVRGGDGQCRQGTGQG